MSHTRRVESTKRMSDGKNEECKAKEVSDRDIPYIQRQQRRAGASPCPTQGPLECACEMLACS